MIFFISLKKFLFPICWELKKISVFCPLYWNDFWTWLLKWLNGLLPSVLTHSELNNWFSTVKPTLHSWYKSHFVMMDCHFYILLDLICYYFKRFWHLYKWSLLVCNFFFSLWCFCQILVSGLSWLYDIIWEVSPFLFSKRIYIRWVLFLP